MCGIRSSSHFPRTRVARMNAAMVSRGPDDARMFTDYFSGVSLAARRLRVIDVSGGRRPMSNDSGAVSAVLDGESYNDPELREALRRRGHRFASGAETEVLVHLLTNRRPALRSRLYGPALREAIRTGLIGDLAGRLNGTSDTLVVPRLMVLDQVHRMPDAGLVKTARAGIRMSLEFRAPYLDHEGARFAATVADHIHVEDGGKALLRGLFAQAAPSAAARCSKKRLDVPTAALVRGPLAPLVDEQLEDGSAFAEGWFDRRDAAAFVAEHRAGTRDGSSAIWPPLAFGLWLDRIRGRGSSDPRPACPTTALAVQGSPSGRP
jgi:asparagine synthetase B (glutamine-hydrolysing)